jgi:hypothetical protein
MGLFSKKPTETPKKTKPAEEPKNTQEAITPRIITAEGWRRKILGKPSEIVPKKRGS